MNHVFFGVLIFLPKYNQTTYFEVLCLCFLLCVLYYYCTLLLLLIIPQPADTASHLTSRTLSGIEKNNTSPSANPSTRPSNQLSMWPHRSSTTTSSSSSSSKQHVQQPRYTRSTNGGDGEKQCDRFINLSLDDILSPRSCTRLLHVVGLMMMFHRWKPKRRAGRSIDRYYIDYIVSIYTV